MKLAADFRQEARDALQGKWLLAILVGLVAAILGGATSDGPEFKINLSGGELDANLQYAGQTIYSWGDGIAPGLRAFLIGGAVIDRDLAQRPQPIPAQIAGIFRVAVQHNDFHMPAPFGVC